MYPAQRMSGTSLAQQLYEEHPVLLFLSSARKNLREITSEMEQKKDKMAAVLASLSVSRAQLNNLPTNFFLVSLYLSHLPHMSDNIESLLFKG